MELRGANDPLPPTDGDGGGGGGSTSGGEPLSDVDDGEDDPSESEGGQDEWEGESRGSMLRLVEIMVAASEADDGGAPGSYEETLKGPEGDGWKKAFDAEVKSLANNMVY